MQHKRQLGQVAGHQHHVRRLQRHIGAAGAHRNPHRRRRQRRRVVDAVAHHRNLAFTHQRLDQFDLLFRQQLGVDIRDAHLGGNGLRHRTVVAGQHHHPLDALLAQPLHRGPRLRAHRVGHRQIADDLPITHRPQRVLHRTAPDHQHRGLALLLEGIADGADGGRYIQIFVHKETIIADIDRFHVIPAVELSLQPMPRHGIEVRRRLQFDPLGPCLLDHRAANVMLAEEFGAARQPQQVRPRVPRQRVDVRHHRLAVGQGPRLVKSDHRDLGNLFQICAALEQHAAARPRGDRAQDTGRCADDQRARAGDHHQRHRPIQCLAKRLVDKQPGNDDCQQRHAEHHIGVARAKTVNKLLRRRGVFLRFRHQFDDLAQRAFRRQLGHLHVQRAAAVDRPRKHLVTRLLLDRHAFPRDRALVHGRHALDHRAIHRQAFAGPHHDHIAHDQRIHAQFDFRAVAADRRHVGPQLCQRLDGLARARHRKFLQRAAQGKEEQQQCAFRPLTDQRRPQCGRDHQKVDVQLAVTRLFDGAHHARIAAGDKRNHRGRRHRPARQPAQQVAAQPADQQRHQRDRGQQQFHVFSPNGENATHCAALSQTGRLQGRFRTLYRHISVP